MNSAVDFPEARLDSEVQVLEQHAKSDVKFGMMAVLAIFKVLNVADR